MRVAGRSSTPLCRKREIREDGHRLWWMMTATLSVVTAVAATTVVMAAAAVISGWWICLNKSKLQVVDGGLKKKVIDLYEGFYHGLQHGIGVGTANAEDLWGFDGGRNDLVSQLICSASEPFDAETSLSLLLRYDPPLFFAQDLVQKKPDLKKESQDLVQKEPDLKKESQDLVQEEREPVLGVSE
ncbi:hypothetical protein Syun_012716 [Stephania yunnanensis]|uniref:Uncharacterized protein n=1 Tax=Stephania yunnanensis TaxID=152371 RepID=A0AAP0K004_9MAGN